MRSAGMWALRAKPLAYVRGGGSGFVEVHARGRYALVDEGATSASARRARVQGDEASSWRREDTR
eukprot:242472-Chlamydomonas_euryale.AAC.1